MDKPPIEQPSLGDLATAAEELHIPLRACRYLLLDMIAENHVNQDGQHYAVAVRALVEQADREAEHLSTQLYERFRARESKEAPE
jgi:hypothetical protein